MHTGRNSKTSCSWLVMLCTLPVTFVLPAADSSWYLQAFQKAEPPFYIEHIHEGVRLAAEDRKALLVFSGGQTRAEAGPRSEALSYWVVAKHFSWWHRASVELRATTEEYARDSSRTFSLASVDSTSRLADCQRGSDWSVGLSRSSGSPCTATRFDFQGTASSSSEQTIRSTLWARRKVKRRPSHPLRQIPMAQGRCSGGNARIGIPSKGRIPIRRVVGDSLIS
jgi:hypothetical protein